MAFFKRRFKVEIKEEVAITLDPQQLEAVTTNKPKTLVVAGAGSGKTRVITERIKHLLLNGVEPHNILAITFTNMASEEMKQRLSSVDGIGDAFIGTIHSFANKVMKNSGKQYQIYNDVIENDYMKYLTKKYCKHLDFDRFLEYKDIQAKVETGLLPDSVLTSFLRPSELAELNLTYGKSKHNEYPETIKTLCARDNIIDFNELLRMATTYFNDNNMKAEYLLVDEFQDIGTLEYSFIKSLNADNEFFVGDDWQSIYSFKGGNVQIMLNLINSGNFQVINLETNYRCCNKVLSTAKIVINQVGNKIEKNIIPFLNEEGEVVIRSKEAILDVLEKNLDEDKLNDWFILVRTNKDLYTISNLLMDNDISNHTFRREGMSTESMNKILSFNSVKVLTVHTAKGLENKNVILYGNFPLKATNYLKNDEERKVMYVGITRAKEKLIICN